MDRRSRTRRTNSCGTNPWSSSAPCSARTTRISPAFRDRGGKLILWHGWADPLIYAEGTTDYYTRVQQQMGGPQKTSAFIRLFMAPGVGHCSGGTGPAPRNPLDALLTWVEQDRAPEVLDAVRRDESGKVVRSRPLCQYPLVARYKGQGSTDEASSFSVQGGFLRRRGSSTMVTS